MFEKIRGMLKKKSIVNKWDASLSINEARKSRVFTTVHLCEYEDGTFEVSIKDVNGKVIVSATHDNKASAVDEFVAKQNFFLHKVVQRVIY